jgi:hypothetical protein
MVLTRAEASGIVLVLDTHTYMKEYSVSLLELEYQ